jgi:hypothetical protein
MDKVSLQKYQDDILSKFRKYQRMKDIGLLHDIQSIVDQVGQQFVVESDKGHRILFRPKKDPHVIEPMKREDRSLPQGFNRTEGGIILPN